MKRQSGGRRWLFLALVTFIAGGIFALTADTTKSTPVTHKIERYTTPSADQEILSTQADTGVRPPSPQTTVRYEVVRVIDGDTIDVRINGAIERVRLIGINTPETVDPRTIVECFGKEASAYASSLLSDTAVELVSDPSQGNRDKYNRLLRYVYLEDGTLVNYELIRNGYAYEYTYAIPYRKQSIFKTAEAEARAEGAGLWGAGCENPTPSSPSTAHTPSDPNCTIKGNINANNEKIYHLPHCEYYNQTRIDEAYGERWFCTESEAVAAGWRKALNCKW